MGIARFINVGNQFKRIKDTEQMKQKPSRGQGPASLGPCAQREEMQAGERKGDPYSKKQEAVGRGRGCPWPLRGVGMGRKGRPELWGPASVTWSGGYRERAGC